MWSDRPLLQPSPPSQPPPPLTLPDPVPSPALKPSSSLSSSSRRAGSAAFSFRATRSVRAAPPEAVTFAPTDHHHRARSVGAPNEVASVTFSLPPTADQQPDRARSFRPPPGAVGPFERAAAAVAAKEQQPVFRREPTRRSGSAGSQRDLRDDEARFVYINDAKRTNAPPARFAGNDVRTSKYSLVTFLPRNLYEQFHRVAYIYFVIVAGLNFVPQLGVFSPATGILPIAFVLVVSAAKDAFEDWRRHRADKEENNREAAVMTDGEFRPKRWHEVRVGDVIRVSANETLPCDLVLLSTADPTGLAYVQTVNLDGETNLKTRYAKQETMKIPPDQLTGLIRCEHPNRNIYGFLANIELVGGAGQSNKSSLGPSNIVLRGCELKNTAWMIGVAVYTGKDTKVMMNSSGPPSKRSRLETQMNRETLVLSAWLVAMCSTVALLAGIWLTTHSDELDSMPFYRKSKFESAKPGKYEWYGEALEVVFTFMSSVIQFQVLIPIALFIGMELVRLGQSYFMVWDDAMYDERRSARFQCRALNINEDLGQIKYIFSDKTGTLTENRMEFWRASVYGRDHAGDAARVDDVGRAITVEGKVLRPKTAVNTNLELVGMLKNGTGAAADRARDFFLAFATCNTIVPIVVDADEEGGGGEVKVIEYQGESPDEQALAYAAAAYGYVLVERTLGHVVVDVFGEKQRYDVLGLHEFDSDRKRMSVIVGCPDNTVKLFVKGADSSMFSVIDKSLNPDVIRATEAHLHDYASQGLRTLVIGMRELTKSEFQQWQAEYEKAGNALLGRGKLLRSLAANVEQNIRLLGASGVEDKLQDGVPDAIESLRRAGIKVWVLTGDKQETAISIGYSCKLLTNEMTQIIVNSHSREACRKALEDAVTMAKKLTTLAAASQSARIPLALVIDGNSLVYVFDSDLEEMLFEVATSCDVVLCCRVAPLQKAGIVALIKKRTEDMTLAIGDGANDVSMIQMADVGIGISGQEGRQAVMASDFAMGQFRFLVPLLLVHGHWNYQRMAYMILYNIYRNAAFVFMLFWYVIYTGFSLTTAITEWSSVLYSVIYTALPTLAVAILDKDLSRRTLLEHPQLYGQGQREEKYNLKLFVLFMLDAIWQSLVIVYVPFFAYRHSTIDESSLGDLWILAIVILVNIHLAMDVIRWNWLTHLMIWGSIVATFICVIIIDAIPILPGYWAIIHVMRMGSFWFCLLAIIVIAMLPRFIGKAVVEYFMPTDIQIAREMEKKAKDLNNTTGQQSSIQMSTAFPQP